MNDSWNGSGEGGADLSHLDRPVELWTRDPQDEDLWHGPHGVIVNSVALAEREAYFHVIRRTGKAQRPQHARRIL